MFPRVQDNLVNIQNYAFFTHWDFFSALSSLGQIKFWIYCSSQQNLFHFSRPRFYQHSSCNGLYSHTLQCHILLLYLPFVTSKKATPLFSALKFMSFTHVVKMQQWVWAMTEILLPQINSPIDSGKRQIEWKFFRSIFSSNGLPFE